MIVIRCMFCLGYETIGFLQMASRFRRFSTLFFHRSKHVKVPLVAASCYIAGLAYARSFTSESTLLHAQSTPEIVVAPQSLVRRKNLADFDKDYKILSKLGEGGFANVYKVQQKSTGFLRTAKIVKFHSQSEADVFKNEVDIMTQLDSPYIARIVEYYTESGLSNGWSPGNQGIIVYHFIDGDDLLDSINERITTNGSFTDTEIRSIVRQILKSLQYLHAKNYVHGDVKPENFIVSSDKTSRMILKLIDFGLSSHDRLNGADIQKAGTSFYMAPEAFSRKEGEYSGKSDSWSVGVIFATIVSRGTALLGRVTSCNTREPIQAIDSSFVEDELVKLEKEGVPTTYIDLIGRLLSHDPKDRISTADALNDPLMAGSYKFDPSFGPNLAKSINGIQRFSELPIFSRLIRLVAAHQINDADVPETRMVFRCLDVDADGLVSIENVLSGNFISGEKPSQALSICDMRGIGNKFGFEDFIAASMPIISDEHLEAIFHEIDTNNRGHINAETLAVFFSQSGFSINTGNQLISSCNNVLHRKVRYLDLDAFKRCVAG